MTIKTSVEVSSIAELKALHQKFGNSAFTKEAQQAKPTSIRFATNFLAELPKHKLLDVLAMTFDVSRRGFRCLNVFKDEGNANAKYTIRQFWELVASQGYTDNAATGFMDWWAKPECYTAPAPKINFCYSADKDIAKWDTNAVYSHVLGTPMHYFSRYIANNDFLREQNITHIVEPMAASGEFCYFGHLVRPDLTYSMLDLDKSAIANAKSLPWLKGSKMEYAYGDVLSDKSWDKLKFIKEGKRTGKSMCFIGKQSQNIFTPVQLAKLLDLCLRYCDFVVLETMEYDHTMFTTPPWVAEATSPAHLKNTDIRVSLEVDRQGSNNRVSFESNLRVVLRDSTKRIEFIKYEPWHCYMPSELVHIAQIALGVDRSKVRFMDDFTSGFCKLDEYVFKGHDRGGLSTSDSDNTFGNIVTLCLSRNY